jgi:hypothetical protein
MNRVNTLIELGYCGRQTEGACFKINGSATPRRNVSRGMAVLFYPMTVSGYLLHRQDTCRCLGLFSWSTERVLLLSIEQSSENDPPDKVRDP